MQVGYTPVRLSSSETVQQSGETDDQIMVRLRERFSMLEDFTKVMKAGKIRSLIVSGGPGVGKSYGVEKVLGGSDVLNQIGGAQPSYEIIKGVSSAIWLYCKLFYNKAHKNVLVFDDCDSPLEDTDSLNMLKACLDTGKRRVLTWNKDSNVLRREDIPSQFEFKGGLILITNENFAESKGKKVASHLGAVIDRSHFLDLSVHTERERWLRIKQVVSDGMLTKRGLSQAESDELLNYVEANRERFKKTHPLTLRTMINLAELKECFPTSWKRKAEVTMMKIG